MARVLELLDADRSRTRDALLSLRIPVDANSRAKIGQRHRVRLRLDVGALVGLQPAPGLDRHLGAGTSPRSDDLAADENGARPDA